MEETKKRLSPFRLILRILAGLLALALLAALVLTLLPLGETVEKTALPGATDWMAPLPDERLLSELTIPGTHDSTTRYAQLGWFSKCQALSVEEQLDMGFRYLDIRLGSNGAGGFQLMHGFTVCKAGPMPWSRALTLDDVLAGCYAFLQAHPPETVLFAVKYEHGDASVSQVQQTLDAYLQKNPEAWLLTDTMPTLGEARGRLVLLRRWEDEAGLGARAGLPLLWEDQKGQADPYLNTALCDQGSYRLWVQDRFEYETEDKWTAFTAGLNPEGARRDDAVLSFLSTKGSAAFGHPWKYAGALNPRLLGLEPESLRGWIAVDFATARLAAQIYGANPIAS